MGIPVYPCYVLYVGLLSGIGGLTRQCNYNTMDLDTYLNNTVVILY